MKKMNNKGFSLVELIIVIAIMAILAGALAPALLRYIEKTRVSNDKKTASELRTAVEIALADETVMEKIEAAATDNFYTFTITTSAAGATYPPTVPTELVDEIKQTLPTAKLKIKSKKDLNKTFDVAIALGESGKKQADVVEVYLKQTSGTDPYLDTQGATFASVARTNMIAP